MPQTDKINKFIKDEITNNPIVLFMKGTKDFPQCGFSSRVVSILNKLNVEFVDINVLEDSSLREGIKIYTNWPTIPQLYIKGEFVGGCDIVSEMYNNEELSNLLKQYEIIK